MILEIDTDKLQKIGENVRAGIINDQLVIIIDPDKKIGLSSTGKMMGVASTNGFAQIPGDLKGNIYIGRKA